MANESSPLTSLQQYRAAADALAKVLEQDPRAVDLAQAIERIVRFELEHQIPQAERFARRIAKRKPERRKRTAIIADIHGNQPGLLAALADIERQGCDRIVCLGDLVDGGPDNEAVIQTIRSRAIASVRGNHDEENDLVLEAASRSFLLGLPEAIVEDDVLYIHISPRRTKRKINHAVEAWNVFDDTAFRLMFVGHVHAPLIFGMRSSAFGEAAKHPFEYNRPFPLAADDRYIVSVGAIGYGRDAVGKVRYGIYDREADAIELRAVDGPVLPLDQAHAGRASAAS